MSEEARGGTPAPETPGKRAVPDSESGEKASTEKDSTEKDITEKDTTEKKEARNDLIIEHWQAPKPDRMKGDSREIWEFESENVRPSGALWFNLAGIILALLLGLALIIYGVWRLALSIGPSVPEIP